jgi:hypothetical protein
MAKRSQSFVPATETGQAAGDGRGQGIGWKNKGGRNATTNEARRGAGQVAPRPQHSKSQLMASSAHTAPVMHSMARVKQSGGAPQAGNFLPVQRPPAGLMGSTIGQPDPHSFNPGGPGISIGPQTKTPVTGNSTATKKPKTRAALAFYGG